MSGQKRTAIKKAILEDVYRDNTQSADAVSRKRRQRNEVVRRRVSIVGLAATLLALAPLYALNAHWAHSTRPQHTPLLSMEHLSTASFMQRQTRHRRESQPFGWFDGMKRATELDTSLRLNSKPYSESLQKALSVKKPAVPQKTWFKGYAGLIGNSDFSLAGLFGLDVKTIVIDAGHGGRDPGAIGPEGLKEKDVTLAVARDLKRRLEQLKGYRVLLTRSTDTYVALKKRTQFANSHHADLFISIHVNSLPEKNRAVAETFYFGPTTSHATLQLVKEENRGSDYTVGDFHKMVEKIGNAFKTQESRALASLIEGSLYQNIQRHNNPRMVNAGIHTAPFVVLLGTRMPSVLAEISCISNPAEAHRLATASYRDAIAKYLEKGIVAYLRRREPEIEPVKGAKQYAGDKKAIHTG